MDANNINNGSKTRIVGYDDVEFSNQELHSSTNIGEIPSVGSMDSIFDELLRDTQHACTHYHTCNPPGPEFPHTHTCVHMHTKIVAPSSNDDSHNYDDSAESREHNGRMKRGWERGGNREAVRKYRQKKKAYTASLADEAVKLRAMNQQLMQRLQGHGALEAEVSRLKCLLVDIRGRIEGEIGSFPYQKPLKTGDLYQNIANNTATPTGKIPCNVQCGPCDDHAGQGVALNGQACSGCDLQNLNCIAGLRSPPSFT